jgi:uncharacterized protein (UPF0147 family)
MPPSTKTLDAVLALMKTIKKDINVNVKNENSDADEASEEGDDASTVSSDDEVSYLEVIFNKVRRLLKL